MTGPRRRFLAVGLLLAVGGGAVFVVGGSRRASTGPPVPVWPSPTRALILMDLQADFTGPGARYPVDPSAVPGLLAAVRTLLGHAPERCHVVQVRTAFPADDRILNWFRNHAAVEGSAGTSPDPRFGSVDGPVVWKARPDAFAGTDLDDILRRKQTSHLILAGVFTEACVYWTARAALNRGYRVTVVTDAVAGSSASATERALADLEGRGVRLASSARAIDGEGEAP